VSNPINDLFEIVGFVMIQGIRFDLAPISADFAQNVKQITLHYDLIFHKGVVESVSLYQVHKGDDIINSSGYCIEPPDKIRLPMYFPNPDCTDPETNRIQQMEFINYRF
jgi:hypothetical protein